MLMLADMELGESTLAIEMGQQLFEYLKKPSVWYR
jgi:hypothetical protein